MMAQNTRIIFNLDTADQCLDLLAKIFESGTPDFERLFRCFERRLVSANIAWAALFNRFDFDATDPRSIVLNSLCAQLQSIGIILCRDDERKEEQLFCKLFELLKKRELSRDVMETICLLIGLQRTALQQQKQHRAQCLQSLSEGSGISSQYGSLDEHIKEIEAPCEYDSEEEFYLAPKTDLEDNSISPCSLMIGKIARSSIVTSSGGTLCALGILTIIDSPHVAILVALQLSPIALGIVIGAGALLAAYGFYLGFELLYFSQNRQVHLEGQHSQRWSMTSCSENFYQQCSQVDDSINYSAFFASF